MSIVDWAWLFVFAMIVGGGIAAAIHDYITQLDREEDDDVHP